MEILQINSIADMADIAQVAIAFFSAIMLFFAFKTQLKSNEVAERVAKMDENAKRADFIPEIQALLHIDKYEESTFDTDGNTTTNLRDVWNFKINFDIIGKPCSVESINLSTTNRTKVSISHRNDFENKIFVKGDRIIVNLKYHKDNFHKAAKESKDKEVHLILNIKDLIGNRYRYIVKVVDSVNFYIDSLHRM